MTQANRSRRQWLAQSAASAAALAFPSLALRAAEPVVKVGLSLPLTATTTADAVSATNIVPDIGQDYLAGFRAGIEAERRGMNIDTVALDDMFKPDLARANIESLERQGVVAISGLWTTEAARAALPVLKAASLPVVGLRSGAPDLRSPKQSVFFHLRPGYEEEVASMVDVMGGAGFTRFGVLKAHDEYGKTCLQLLQANTRAKVVKVASVTGGAAEAAQAAREVVSADGVQSLILLAPVESLAPVMTELRLRTNPFLAPVSALSHVLCNKLAVARDPVYRAFAVTCPYQNPFTSRAEVAGRFRDAMADIGLDHADRSYSAFEGFVAGSLVARNLVAVRNTPTRDALARALRSRTHDLGGLRIAFDDRQVGHRHVSFLYKSPVDGIFRS